MDAVMPYVPSTVGGSQTRLWNFFLATEVDPVMHWRGQHTWSLNLLSTCRTLHTDWMATKIALVSILRRSFQRFAQRNLGRESHAFNAFVYENGRDFLEFFYRACGESGVSPANLPQGFRFVVMDRYVGFPLHQDFADGWVRRRYLNYVARGGEPTPYTCLQQHGYQRHNFR